MTADFYIPTVLSYEKLSSIYMNYTPFRIPVKAIFKSFIMEFLRKLLYNNRRQSDPYLYGMRMMARSG